MPLDPLIVNGIRPVEVEPYGAAAARSMSLRNMFSQRQINDLSLEQATRASDREKQAISDDKGYREAFARNGGDTKAVLRDLFAAGNPRAFDLQKTEDAREKEATALWKEKLANAKEEAAQLAAGLNAINNEADPAKKLALYTHVRNSVIQRGANAEKIPEQYDPVYVAAMIAEGTVIDKQIEAAQKAIDQAETARKNKASEANDVRGQDLTATTTREGHAVQTRGQDLQAATSAAGHKVQTRGQDLQAATAAAGHAVQTRGQNMTDDRARDLNAITRDNKPPTADESKNWGFYTRANDAEKALSSADKSMKAKGITSQLYQKHAPGIVQTEENQSYDQGKRQFIAAYLRRDSGAVISPSEFNDADMTFFPQPGEGTNVQEQKRQARLLVIDTLKAGAGRAMDKFGDREPAAPGKYEGTNPNGITVDTSRVPKDNGLSVTDPDGNVHRFKSKAQADGFRRAAGIK